MDSFSLKKKNLWIVLPSFFGCGFDLLIYLSLIILERHRCVSLWMHTLLSCVDSPI